MLNKCENTDLKDLNDPKAFIEYRNDMGDIYNNIQEYSPNKKRKILIGLDNVIAGMLSNKKRDPIVTESVVRGRKLTISLVFIT